MKGAFVANACGSRAALRTAAPKPGGGRLAEEGGRGLDERKRERGRKKRKGKPGENERGKMQKGTEKRRQEPDGGGGDWGQDKRRRLERKPD